MECSFAALIACFSWGNLYIDTQASYVDRAVPYLAWRNISPPARDGIIETAHAWTITNENENPYLRNAVGIKLPFRSIDVSAEFFHDSSMSSKRDRGVNGFALRAQWFPFRR